MPGFDEEGECVNYSFKNFYVYLNNVILNISLFGSEHIGKSKSGGVCLV